MHRHKPDADQCTNAPERHVSVYIEEFPRNGPSFSPAHRIGRYGAERAARVERSTYESGPKPCVDFIMLDLSYYTYLVVIILSLSVCMSMHLCD